VASGAIEVTAPFRAFAHSESAPGYQVQAITGSDWVYTGSAYPAALQNNYFFTDFVQGEVYAVDVNDSRSVQFLYNHPGGLGPVRFVPGPDGFMYYADLFGGTLGRLLIEPNDPTTPRLTARVDDVYQLYVNGAQVLSGSDWRAAATASLALQPGDEIAIHALDTGGPAGVFVDMVLADGTRLASSSAWRVSPTPSPAGDWTAPGYDDSTWLAASEFGGVSAATWSGGAIAPLLPADSTGQWIWSSDNENVNELYLRFTVPGGGGNTAPVAAADTAATSAAIPIAVDVLANDSPSGDALTITRVQSTTGTAGRSDFGAAVAITVTAGSQRVSYDGTAAAQLIALAAGASLADRFTYVVSDSTGGTATGTATVTVTGVNDPPTITSNGGGDSAALSLAENATAVTTVAASDPDSGASLTYAIVGGADASRFSLNATTGALAFVVAPDFESPGDAGANNVYDVVIEVSDGAGTHDTQAIAITVTDAGGTSPPASDAAIITGTAEADILTGLGGSNTINGLGGDDLLSGAGGNDSLNGGAGNDKIIYAIGDGADAVDGGAGSDTLEIRGSTAADILDVIYNGTSLVSFEGGTLTGVEAVAANLLGGSDRLSYAGTSAGQSRNVGCVRVHLDCRRGEYHRRLRQRQSGWQRSGQQHKRRQWCRPDHWRGQQRRPQWRQWERYILFCSRFWQRHDKRVRRQSRGRPGSSSIRSRNHVRCRYGDRRRRRYAGDGLRRGQHFARRHQECSEHHDRRLPLCRLAASPIGDGDSPRLSGRWAGHTRQMGNDLARAFDGFARHASPCPASRGERRRLRLSVLRHR
jgi:VCBS repeat-containing protein